MQPDIALLRQQHRAIRDAIDHLDALVNQSFAEAAPHLPAARLRLAKTVSDNMASETAEIHEPLQRHKLTGRIPAYAGIAEATRELRLVFSAHVGRWVLPKIAADWTGYGRSLRTINADLVEILAWEERDLFPAAVVLLATVPS